MRILFDFFPILLFFIAYKLSGIYVATVTAMVASIIQASFHWLRFRSIEKVHIITLVLVIVLGGATLLLHDETFIKWKPTAIYWVLAITFISSHYIGEKLLIQRMMDNKINLPPLLWRRLNISWSIFFSLLGSANLFVVYYFSTDIWVNFKLFGILGLTLIFTVLQGLYMSRHVALHNNQDENPNGVNNPT